MSTRARWRRLWMGLATLAGRSRGFFSPYRYAAEVAPTAYPELEAQFQAAEPQIRDTLDEISAASPDLAALAGPPPRPRWDQHWFPRLDGAAAYAMI
ncbi:MAG: class I SAM-dependent methyltransferase, partial [Pseudomonadota bacterium]